MTMTTFKANLWQVNRCPSWCSQFSSRIFFVRVRSEIKFLLYKLILSHLLTPPPYPLTFSRVNWKSGTYTLGGHSLNRCFPQCSVFLIIRHSPFSTTLFVRMFIRSSDSPPSDGSPWITFPSSGLNFQWLDPEELLELEFTICMDTI